MSLVPLGLWLAIIGYGVAFAGMQKLGGDPSYSVAAGFRNQPPAQRSAQPQSGTTQKQAAEAATRAQLSVISTDPVAA